MTHAPTPGMQLRAAAAVIRQHATHATPGPWHYLGNLGDFGGHLVETIETNPPDYREPRHEPHIDAASEHDAKWIAAMSPAVADPLAQWLDFEATRVDVLPAIAEDIDGSKVTRWALQLAEAVIKAAEDTPA